MATDWAVIFDVDGVLVDSSQAHRESWRRLCRERGLEMTDEQFAATFGRTSREIIRALWGDRIAEEAAVAELDDRKEALYREILREQFPAMDGAADLIRQLHASGVRLAVGSSGPPENVQLVVDALGCRECFGAIVTGKDVVRGKPDPQVFLLAAERLGVAPARCVVIEDAPVGVAAAHAAGMKCIAVTGTSRERETLAAADRIVARLTELNPAVISSLLDEQPVGKP